MIEINADATLAQPSTVKEEVIQKVVDKTSITGTTRRIWMAQKKQVTLGYRALNNTQYNAIVAYFYGNANAITYLNTVSTFTFTGFATAAEADFYQGNSYLKDLNITIVEQ